MQKRLTQFHSLEAHRRDSSHILVAWHAVARGHTSSTIGTQRTLSCSSGTPLLSTGLVHPHHRAALQPMTAHVTAGNDDCTAECTAPWAATNTHRRSTTHMRSDTHTCKQILSKTRGAAHCDRNDHAQRQARQRAKNFDGLGRDSHSAASSRSSLRR